MQLKYSLLKIFFLILFLQFSLISCKDNKSSSNVVTPTEGIYDSKEFQEFYEKFSTDSLFQIEHIVFPLEGMRSLQDSLDIPDPNFRWTQDKWKIHKSYDDMNGTFSREFIDFAGIVVEKISDTSGQYTMERRFGKLSSGWHLIYYKEMGPN